MITHQMQPTNATCVQTCLAMLLGLPVDKVLEKLPHKNSGTRHKPMVEFLREHGVQCADRLTILRKREVPPLALVRIRWPNKKAHLVLKVRNAWHDPELPAPFTGRLPPDRSWANQGRVTSFLEIEDGSSQFLEALVRFVHDRKT